MDIHMLADAHNLSITNPGGSMYLYADAHNFSIPNPKMVVMLRLRFYVLVIFFSPPQG